MLRAGRIGLSVPFFYTLRRSCRAQAPHGNSLTARRMDRGRRSHAADGCIFEAARSMIHGSKSPTRPKDPEGRLMAHRFTIGVEEEFQIIDPATCELRSHVSQIVSAASPDIAEQVKHELHQSIVETGTRICE